MTSRAEFTTSYARSFRAADKRTKGRILDEVVSVTGWSRDNARRRLTSAAQSPPAGGWKVGRAAAAQAAGDQVLLRRVEGPAAGCGRPRAGSAASTSRHRCARSWTASNGTASSSTGVGRYSMAVRAELLAMSAASIDRYLRPAKATDQIRGVSTTKPSPLLRSSIKMQEIPFTITGLDFDNGTEFLNKAVITWAGERDIYFTRSRLMTLT